jgi:hypothetical protein
MSEAERHALVQALITEAVSLAVMGLVLWGLAHKTDLEHYAWRLLRRTQARETAADAAYRQASRSLHDDIRRMEYDDG